MADVDVDAFLGARTGQTHLWRPKATGVGHSAAVVHRIGFGYLLLQVTGQGQGHPSEGSDPASQ